MKQPFARKERLKRIPFVIKDQDFQAKSLYRSRAGRYLHHMAVWTQKNLSSIDTPPGVPGRSQHYWKKNCHAPENMKKTPFKVPHNRPPILFFSIANQPKTSPNLIFCSIKNISLRNFYIMTLLLRLSAFLVSLQYNNHSHTQGRTKWRNCRLTTKTPNYQLGWAILVECR